MNNNISNGLLIFRTALIQFGDVSYQLAREIVKLPFYDGWRWMVVTGLPVLLITSGTGAVIFAVATKCIRAVGSTLYTTAKIIKNFYNSRSVIPLKQNPLQPSNPSNSIVSFHNRSRQPALSEQPQGSQDLKPVARQPLPIDAAKERNESFIKLLALTEKYMIDPLMERKGLLFEGTYTKEELKCWLMSMTLWQLGIVWDKLENEYLQMKTPPPPTLESIINEAKQINTQIGGMFQESIQTFKQDLIPADKCLENILNAIRDSGLSNHNKSALALLHFELDTLFKKSPVSNESKIAEQEEHRKKFASIMNRGIANTMVHMSDMIAGWVDLLNPPVVSLPALPAFPVNALPRVEGNANSISKLVENASTRIQEDLPAKYLVRLWHKKSGEWDISVAKDLKNIVKDLEKQNPGKPVKLFDDFMNMRVNEKKFLEEIQSHSLPTSIISNVFFMRAIRCMGYNQESFKGSTQNILRSLLAQLEPTLIDVLTKSADTLSHISFESAIPKVVDYFVKVLDCCTATQGVRQEENAIQRQTDSDNYFIEVLERAEVQSDKLNDINQLYKDISPQISGKDVIKDLPKQSVHDTVLRGLDSPLYEAEQYEAEWIRITKEKLKTLLLVRAKEYAREKGNWFSKFFQINPIGQPNNLVSMLLEFSNNLRNFSGLERVTKFLFSSIELALEDKGCDAIQSALNEFTSTGYLSTNIATILVKGLLDKEDEKWKENIGTLRQAYLFLQPEEQEKVLKHLEAQCDNSTFERRRKDLNNSDSCSFQGEIKAMQKRENDYKDAKAVVDEAIVELKNNVSASDQQDIILRQQNDIALLEAASEKLNREKELQQFDRMRKLVTYAADKFLQKKIKLPVGEDAVRSLCIQVIHETLPLLKYQEIIKHWIFTIVDLVVKELQKSSRDSKQIANIESTNEKSLFDFISPIGKANLLQSINNLMQRSKEDKGWLNTETWLALIAGKFMTWKPDIVWGFVEGGYREKTKITPAGLKDNIIEWLDKFGADKNGLSDLIIRALTEHVADPRPQVPGESAAARRKSMRDIRIPIQNSLDID